MSSPRAALAPLLAAALAGALPARAGAASLEVEPQAATSTTAVTDAVPEPSRPRPAAERPRAFEAADWVVSTVLGVSVLAAYAALAPARGGPTGGWLFDDSVRRSLRADARAGRELAKQASDVGQWLLLAQPLVVDAGLVAWGLRGDRALALRLALVDAQALLAALLFTELTKDLVGRERPYADTCGPGACSSASRRQSFVSGHTSAAFVGAALGCLHHTELALYGGGAPDLVACSAGLGLASVVGALRVVADEHWATDVLAGAGAGLVFGWLLPRLFFYATGSGGGSGARGAARRGEDPGGLALLPIVGPDGMGLSVVLALP